MTLDTRMILGARGPNVLGALADSTNLAATQQQMAQANRLAPLEVERAKLGNEATRQSMSIQREDLAMRRAAAARQAQEYAAGLDAAAAAAAAQRIEQSVARALAAPDAATYDAMMAASPDTQQYVGTFDQREVLGASFLGIKDALEAVKPKETEFMNVDGIAYRVDGDQLVPVTEPRERRPLVQINDPGGVPASNAAEVDLGNVGGAFGASDTILNAVNAVTDSIFGAEFRPDSAQAATVIQDTNDRAMLVGAANFPGRPSNLTRERLERTLPQPGMKGDANALRKANGTRAFFAEGLVSAKQALLNPDLTANAQIELQRYISAAEPLLNFYTRLAMELENGGGQPAQPTPGEGTTSSGIKYRIVD